VVVVETPALTRDLELVAAPATTGQNAGNTSSAGAGTGTGSGMCAPSVVPPPPGESAAEEIGGSSSSSTNQSATIGKKRKNQLEQCLLC
jgi:hypothetical protein